MYNSAAALWFLESHAWVLPKDCEHQTPQLGSGFPASWIVNMILVLLSIRKMSREVIDIGTVVFLIIMAFILLSLTATATSTATTTLVHSRRRAATSSGMI
ncbi:hypothetical protein M747DRAFT_306354 [Aspergillus niger ATCC 13496]|uniref:Uncharacterized protein n=1 Tax=Aspergillus niger ATCC 13496 TaxID=1353008 RepID=A0A370C2J2_ASPNG|nr:hypothetical protein M747DRAFT_306354 [Aspergillus niger ATCC 13496]